ncbi:winged helix-turn-helix domain-containing protein [Gilvimarinus agarilyticus]|uniref:winged helix-turn-helix domain-containing protein n=1 Tax=Gilvimarinus agarilyticus TaxID=679259 RepID=UPI001E591579|nr:winged helix-turn-helix domain-containing protein [Gilvimarinus agarilyticus]
MELFLMSVVLLAEDDQRLAGLVKDFLQANGFTVVVESMGLNVPRQVLNLQPDIVILDLMLPGKDGISICKEIRPQYEGPVLMLTARDTDADQVLGFEVGADDYVIKPAEPRVLLARINALLRRANREPVETGDISVGRLAVRTRAREVCLADEVVPLSSHEYDLLLTLARQAGKVLSREYLFTTICQRPYDGLDRTVDVRISHLRKKLGDNSDNPTRIKTVWGRGYMLVADAWE